MADHFTIGTSALQLRDLLVAHYDNVFSIKMLLDLFNMMGIYDPRPADPQEMDRELFFE